MQISNARAIVRSHDEVYIVKPHPFGRSLTCNFCKLIDWQDRDEGRFVFVEGYSKLVCQLNEQETSQK